ncbi:hypothetical protein HK099_007369, partial [Clydaea vesicula]
MFTKLFLTLCILILPTVFAVSAPQWVPFKTDAYSGHQTLTTSSNKSIELFWSVDVAANQVEFGVASKNGATWLALGLSESGSMQGADIWLGYTDPTIGKFVLEDRFSPSVGAPILDKKQDVTLLQSFQTAELTAFTFKRSLTPCDLSQDSKIETEVPNHFIFAFGTDNNFNKHLPGRNGIKEIELIGNYFTNINISEADQKNSTIFNMVTKKIEIPANDTTYCYTLYDLSDMDKSHIIKEVPVVNSPLLHHLVGYLCDTIPANITTTEPICNVIDPITQLSDSDFQNTCWRTYLLWGKGGEGRTYPATAGKPLGRSAYGTQYLLLESHYANPELLTGQVDVGSGLELTLTKNLRPHDVGILFAGRDQDVILLEPGNSSQSIYGRCGLQCTEKGIPDEGLTITATFFHMHKRGISGETQWIRNGIELPPLTTRRYYDFNFQISQNAPLSQEKLMPGDTLITRCTYDTSKDTKPVRGGFTSDNEMCINFIEYYPVAPLFHCTDTIDIPAQLNSTVKDGLFCGITKNG